jgi:hypothetical protein
VTLRPYQVEPIQAILKSIKEKAGRTFVIMISRQSGKDELLCHLKMYLLEMCQEKDREIVEFNPTYKPQTIRAILRLENRMQTNVLTRNRWKKRSDFMRTFGQAKATFFSGDGQANVVGATANLLLIINEAQHISTNKYDRDAAPMAASTNATRVIVGTAWTANTLLARELRAARGAQEADGIRRVFIYTAEDVRKFNPSYGKFVDGEIERLGRNHPLVRTQYFCEEIDAQVGMFTAARRALMQADQQPHADPVPASVYCFLLDVAGQDEARMTLDEEAPLQNPGRDSVSLTIATIDGSSLPTLQQPTYRFVNRVQWTGLNHITIFGKLKNLVETWRPQYIVVDATGVGEGLWAMLDKAFPTRVIPVKFTSTVKSEMGWKYISIIETGRLHDCTRTATSGSSVLRLPHEGQTPAYDKVLAQYEACQAEIMPGPGKLLRWGVPEGQRGPSGDLIHDDYLLADALISQIDMLEWSASTDLFAAEGYDPLDARLADQPPGRHIDDTSRRWPDL